MRVSHNHVITLHYQLKDDNEVILDKSYDSDEPMVYLHGHRQMIRGFEAAIAGAEVGEKRVFSVMPADGYGLRNVNNTQRIPVKYLKHEGKLSAGQAINVNTDNGVKPGTIIKVGKFNADVDMNHPLAGKNLHFDTEIIAIRAATKEEIGHGHVHGSGGCDH
ncbi:peptidylprolyl isomerase [Porticoccaceae bacterium]|nr:peptidylprolyl isomerase [Porticoccaceae bacterium]